FRVVGRDNPDRFKDLLKKAQDHSMLRDDRLRHIAGFQKPQKPAAE
ncbi:MAG: hypothetical protein HQL33_01600, partial [Alphaproteobacteria bacterium]|nr:hypothetical protein [Alphaproteobacteria bacterium]